MKKSRSTPTPPIDELMRELAADRNNWQRNCTHAQDVAWTYAGTGRCCWCGARIEITTQGEN